MSGDVIGIDPSTTSTGFATIYGTDHMRSKTEAGDQRLEQVYEMTLQQVHEGVTHAVVEDLLTHAQGTNKSGMTHGVIRLALLICRVPYICIAPSTLKKYATGNGRSEKSDMRMALYQRAGIDLRNDDEVDAWWLRALGFDLLGQPLFTMPAENRKALAKINREAWE